MVTRPIARGVTVAATALLAVACGDRSEPAGAYAPTTPGVLAVATNLPAPGFWEGDGTSFTGGFEHDLALALMDRFGLDSLEVVPMPFEAIVAGDLGGADLALAQVTPTDERDEVLDFTTPYLGANPAAIVRPGTELRDLAAARDLTWAVQSATTEADLVDEVIRPTSPAVEVADIAAVVDAVASGEADAGLLDLPTALVEEQLTGGQVVAVAQFQTGAGLSIAVPEGSDNLEALDSAVRSFVADGTIDGLAERYLAVEASGALADIPLIRSQPAP